MKGLWIAAAAALTLGLAAPVKAEGILMVGGGSASATYDYQDSANTFEGWNDELDHDMTGTASAAGLFYASEFGLLVGAGYHSYDFSGKASWERENYALDGITFERLGIEFTKTSLSLSGPFAALGLNIHLGDAVRLLPQVRQGQAKAALEEEATLTGTYLGTTFTEKAVFKRPDETVTLRVYSLPVLVKLTDNLLLGLEAQQFATTLEFVADNETITLTPQTAYMASLNVLF